LGVSSEEEGSTWFHQVGEKAPTGILQVISSDILPYPNFDNSGFACDVACRPRVPTSMPTRRVAMIQLESG